MSVLKKERKVSRYEFENSYLEFYKFMKPKLNKIPKRRYKYIGKPLYNAINYAYKQVINVNSYLFRRKEYKDKEIHEKNVQMAILSIHKIQKPLIVYWNIMKISFEEQCKVAQELNRILALLGGLQMSKKKPKSLMVMDWGKIKSTNYINKITILHRYMHSKVISAVDDLENVESSMLVQYVDDLLFQVITANNVFPRTQEEYEFRTKKLDKAISDLYFMQRPMLAYFNIMEYSEEIINHWIELQQECLKLLYGVKKSDKRRFNNLPTIKEYEKKLDKNNDKIMKEKNK